MVAVRRQAPIVVLKSLLLVLAIAVVVAVFVSLNRLRRRAGSPVVPTEPAVLDFSDVPDIPVGFGRKNFWVAVRSEDSETVAASIGLEGIEVANWRTGFMAAYAYPSRYLFVTPPLEGWVLAVGRGWPDLADPVQLPRWRQLMSSISSEFGELYFFATHRVSSFTAWAKFEAGTEVRLFAHADETIHNLGQPLPEEAPLVARLADPYCEEASDDSYWDREELWYPEEEDVLRFAGLWSFDPCSLDESEYPASTGHVGELVYGS